MSEIINENRCYADDTTEDYDYPEVDYTERIRRSRERGPDRKPRTLKVNSMRNLKQFKEKPEEFVQYLKEEKGLDITGNSKLVKPVLILVGLILATSAGWILYNHYSQNKQDDENIEESY